MHEASSQQHNGPEYETPRVTDHGTLVEFTAGMHDGHHLDSAFSNHDGPDPRHSTPL